MKVLFVGLARVIWLFDVNRLNPSGLSIQPAIQAIAEKYKFAKAPKNALDFDPPNTLSFKSGTFVTSKGKAVLVSFSVYSDGFVADTTSDTDDSSEFLTEILNLLATDFGLVRPGELRKVYISQMDVECVTPLVQLSPKITDFVQCINSRVQKLGAAFPRYEFTGLAFWTEDVTKPGALAPIKFERKFNAPFSANHYFAQAPLETKSHVDLLNDLEAVMKEEQKKVRQ